jgi:hypothetical protein
MAAVAGHIILCASLGTAGPPGCLLSHLLPHSIHGTLNVACRQACSVCRVIHASLACGEKCEAAVFRRHVLTCELQLR